MKKSVGRAALVAAGAVIVGPGMAHAEGGPSSLSTTMPGALTDAGVASPSEVHAAMQAMGMRLAETPVSRVLASAAPTGGEVAPQKVICSSGSYCVVVKRPQLENASADATEALVKSIQAARPATAGAVLAEMSRHIGKGQEWSMTLGADGSVSVA